MQKICLASLGLFTIFFTGCAIGPRVTEPMRAVWVTRWDYKEADDITRIMDNCADAGFNTVLFQVRGNGTVFYDSPHEPWAEEFDFKSPGYDPLQKACHEARRRGLDLHAWVNVMPAWRGPKEPAAKNQLYHTHPEWFWYDKDGNRQPLNHTVGNKQRGWYVSLNPCLPEVRDYLAELFADIAARYEIQGLHMDYIRFPREPVVSGEVIPDYPRDERTLALYKADTDFAPDDDENAWTEWRIEQVNKLVKEIHGKLRRARPAAVLTAAVGSEPDRATKSYFQDARTWMDRGIIDAVVLMNYTSDPTVFEQRIDPWLAHESTVPIVPGFWFGSQPGKTQEQAAEIVRRQMEIANEKTGNFCAFAYSSMFESPNPEPGQQGDGKRSVQRVRREVLIPYMTQLAEANR